MSAGHPPRPLCPGARTHIPSTAGQLGDSPAKPSPGIGPGTGTAAPRSLLQLRTMEVNGPGRILWSAGGRNAGSTLSAPAFYSSTPLQNPGPASHSSIPL